MRKFLFLKEIVKINSKMLKIILKFLVNNLDVLRLHNKKHFVYKLKLLIKKFLLKLKIKNSNVNSIIKLIKSLLII